MKTSLRFSFLFLLVSFFSFVQAQNGNGNGNGNNGNGNGNTCVVEQVGIQVTNSVATASGGCTVTANIYFVAKERNNGQKFFNVHLWQQANRPANLNFDNPLPTSALNAALRNFVIEDKGQGNVRNWQLSRYYNRNENNAAFNIGNATLTVYRVRKNEPIPPGLESFSGFTYFIISNVVFTTTTPCNNLGLIADVTGANAAQNQNMQCTNTGLAVFTCQTPQQNYDPSLSAEIICTTPNRYTITANNSGGCFPYYISYDVYADLNDNGVVDPGEPEVGGGPQVDYFIIFPGQVQTKPARDLSSNALNANLIIANIRTFTADPSGVREELLGNETIFRECAEGPLPVTFKSFNANRKNNNRQQVELSWETAMEQNNKGFHVQRKVTGGWETVAFVFSAAEGGNSTDALRYSFVDNNNAAGISQYRLLQEDIDGRGAYSAIKSVRGVGLQSGLVVYPNPAVGGKASVLFADVQTTRDVMIADMSGRIVKQYREVADNTLTIEGLAGGFYTIRVVDKKTSTVEVAKLVVQ